MDDLISAFVHVANYRSWWKGELIGEGLDHFSLKLKVVAKCSDLKVLADAMKVSLGQQT